MTLIKQWLHQTERAHILAEEMLRQAIIEAQKRGDTVTVIGDEIIFTREELK